MLIIPQKVIFQSWENEVKFWYFKFGHFATETNLTRLLVLPKIDLQRIDPGLGLSKVWSELANRLWCGTLVLSSISFV